MKFFANRVAFSIFGVDIYWYAIIITCAIILALILTVVLVKIKGLDNDLPVDAFIAIIPLGIIFARLFSVLFSGAGIQTFFEFRNGGMSIIGAIIGGVIGILLLCLVKKKYIFFHISDVVAPVLILAQAIGRWGNYVNGEVYGWQVTSQHLQFFPFAVNIGENWFLALFFYEFIFDLIGAVVLFLVFLKTEKTGLTTAIYLIYYGAVRLVLETFRDTKYVLTFLGLPISQIVSAIFLICGVVILIFIIAKSRKNKELHNQKNRKNKNKS